MAALNYLNQENKDTYTRAWGLRNKLYSIYIILQSVFVFFPTFIFSQSNTDSTSNSNYKLDSIFTPAKYCWWSEKYISIDSSLESYNENADFIRANFPFIVNTENVGSATNFIKFSSDSFFLNTPRLNALENSYQLTRLNGVFNQTYPYTHAMFVSGPKNEQDLYAEYGIQLKKMFRLGAKYVGTGGDGIYEKTSNKFSNLNIYAGFTSKNRLYNCMLNGEMGKNKVSENGGITEDTSDFFSVKLHYAQNYFKNRALALHQELNLKFDSITVLNENMVEEKNTIPLFEILHSTTYQTKANTFTDDLASGDNSNYNYFYIDSSSTKDSTHIADLTNTIAFLYRKLNLAKNGGLQFSVGGIHQLINLYQDSVIQKSYSNIASNISAKIFSLKQSASISSAYTLSGYNMGDYYFHLNYIHLFGDSAKKSKTVFYSNAFLQNNTPSYFHQNYYSNHFKWENNFNDIKIIQLNLGFEFKKPRFKTEFLFYNLKNYIYYGLNINPIQISYPLNIFMAQLSKDISVGKFHFNSLALIQKCSNEKAIHLPLLYLKQSVYFESMVFKKALLLQLGLALNYFTSYNGDAYMPALGQFYLQNQTAVGNYPFVDAFTVGKIKRVRLFIKFQHITSGLINGQEYMVPFYPVAPRMLKWGVSWMFFD